MNQIRTASVLLVMSLIMFTLSYSQLPCGIISGGGGGGGGGSTSPGGTNTAVQFNDSSVFGGDSTNFKYNKTTHVTTSTGGFDTGGTTATLDGSTDGYFLMTDNVGTSFTGLRFGGTTSSFPMWKRSGAAFIARLADDSANAALTVASCVGCDVNNLYPCDFIIGDTTGSVLIDAQLGPQKGLCFVPRAATVVEIDVFADGGTPNIIVGVNHAGSVANLLSSALATASSGGRACSKTTGIAGIDGTTCSATLQNTAIAAGDYIQAVSGTAGGVAKLLTVHIIYKIT